MTDGVGGGESAFDAELSAFLGREASRRTLRRRSDGDVVAAIVARYARAWPRRFVAAVASGGLTIALVVAALALDQRGGLLGGATAAPPSIYEPPFELPAVAPGEPCPDTERWLIGIDALPQGAAIGGRPTWATGPRPKGIYAFLAESGWPAFFEDETVGIGSPWKRIDALWVAEPGFTGRVVVQGARLDTPGEVSFGGVAEREPMPTLTLDGSYGQPVRTSGWTVIGEFPMLVREPGCYGLRIHTEGGSTVSVFEVRPIEEAYEALERRPFQLPNVPSGEACPITPAIDVVSFVRGEIGTGLVFLDFDGRWAADHSREPGPVFLSFDGGRAVWVADSRELGPILLRGGRIDGPGELRFGTDATPQLRLPIHAFAHSAGQPTGWRQFISPGTALRPSVPGCYAVQVDTLPYTLYLVLEVAP